MGMTKTAEALQTDTIEIAAGATGWTRIASLPQAGTAELREALLTLAEDGVIELEPEPLGFRITPADRAAAVIVGGEPMHLIKLI